jgi:hypothetical protein
MEYERNFLIELKNILIYRLNLVDIKIKSFPISGSDKEYNHLINKAIYYRDQINKVNQELRNL